MPAGEEQFHRRVWRHRVGTPPDDDVLVHGEGSDPTTYFGVHTSRDGRWLVVSGSAGTAPRDDVWIADLAGDGAAARASRSASTRRPPRGSPATAGSG